MEKKHPVNEVMGITMEKVKEMIDVNTVVGEPIHTAEGVTVIPVSKISVGFASGGADYAGKNQSANKDNAFGGGSGAGISIDPVAFLIIRNDTARLLPVAPLPGGPVEKVIDLMPEIIDRVGSFIEDRKAEKAKKEAANSDSAE